MPNDLQLSELTSKTLPLLKTMTDFVDGTNVDEFLKPVGQHYQLLSQYAMGLNDSIIVDIGTWKGSSAVALSVNSSNTVYSFDILDQRGNRRTPFNVQYVIGDLLELLKYNPYKCNWGDLNEETLYQNWPMMRYWPILQKAKLIVVDVHNIETGNHDGVLEQKFYDLLVLVGFRGVAIFDDIHLTPETRKFWDGVTLEKMDITHLGHSDFGAGTGIVDFGKAPVVVPKWEKLTSANGRPYNHVD